MNLDGEIQRQRGGYAPWIGNSTAQTLKGIGAPGPRGVPLVGSVPSLIKGEADYLRAVALEHGGVVELKLVGSMRMYLLSHPDHVRHVLQTKPANYRVKLPPCIWRQ